MIDTHCHLDYLDDPASARFELGLSALVCVGASVEHAHNALALAAQYPEVYASVGLHPTEVAEHDAPQTRQELERLSQEPGVVAIGETGLDDYWSQLEAAYYNGSNELPVTITETIQEVNGSISQYRYLQVLLTIEDAGMFKGDASVHQKVRFVAARRVKVS